MSHDQKRDATSPILDTTLTPPASDAPTLPPPGAPQAEAATIPPTLPAEAPAETAPATLPGYDALRRRVRDERMQLREPRQADERLVDHGVVLHGARSQRVHGGGGAVVPL